MSQQRRMLLYFRFNNVNSSIHPSYNLQAVPWLGCGLSLSKFIVQCDDTDGGRDFKRRGLLGGEWGQGPLVKGSC